MPRTARLSLAPPSGALQKPSRSQRSALIVARYVERNALRAASTMKLWAVVSRGSSQWPVGRAGKTGAGKTGSIGLMAACSNDGGRHRSRQEARGKPKEGTEGKFRQLTTSS